MYKGKIARQLSIGLAATLWLVPLLSLSETATANDRSFTTVHDRIFPKSGAYKLDTWYKCEDHPTSSRGEQGPPVQCPSGSGEARTLYEQMDRDKSESKQFGQKESLRYGDIYYNIRYTASSEATKCYVQTTPQFGANYICFWKAPKGFRYTSQSNEY
jgi:hypothetical protein